MAEHWTGHPFWLGHPRYDGAGDLPLLLRRLAEEIEDQGITGTDVDDLTVSQEITEDGPWSSATEEPTRVPVADALPGVHLHPLPGDEVVVAFAMVKTRDTDGLAGAPALRTTTTAWSSSEP